MKKIFSIFIFAVICCLLSVGTIAGNSQCVVNFDFDGLQVIAFGDPGIASDGILDVVNHHPQIQISKIQNSKTSILTTISEAQLKHRTINISIPNKESNPTRYITPDMTRDTSDFRWCLDMESDLFQKTLYLKQDKFFSKIHFHLGQFYASRLTDEKYQFFNGTTQHSFSRRIGEPSAKLNLNPMDILTIAGLTNKIELPYEAGVSYSISITNLPPRDMMSMDHFAFYYDFIEAKVPRFMPAMVQKSSYFPRPALCESIVLTKSTIN